MSSPRASSPGRRRASLTANERQLSPTQAKQLSGAVDAWQDASDEQTIARGPPSRWRLSSSPTSGAAAAAMVQLGEPSPTRTQKRMAAQLVLAERELMVADDQAERFATERAAWQLERESLLSQRDEARLQRQEALRQMEEMQAKLGAAVKGKVVAARQLKQSQRQLEAALETGAQLEALVQQLETQRRRLTSRVAWR